MTVWARSQPTDDTAVLGVVMRTPEEYKRAWAVVVRVTHEWDPYGLLQLGAPADEFDGEITAVLSQVPRIRSADDAARVISQVFTAAFEPKGFTPEDCADVGRRLFRGLA